MDNRLNRRQFLKILAAGTTSLVGTGLVACGAGGTTPAASTDGATTAVSTDGAAAPTTAPQAAAPSGQLQTVRALAWSNGPAIDENFTRRAQAFNEAHQGEIEVDLQFLPYDQYWQKIDLAYASNQPYDIYYWDVQAYGHYKRGLLHNVQPQLQISGDLIDSATYPVHLYEPWKFDGANLYGVPENIQTMVFFYNKDIFDKAGVKYPDDTWTWDDVVATAKQLTVREGDNVTQWGMDIGTLGVWWGLQTLSWAQGDAFFDKVIEPTKFNMQSEANIASLRFVQDLIWKERVAPNAEQRTSVGQDVGVFQSGQTAMIPDGSWSIAGFSSLPFNWDIAPLPKWGDKRVVPYWLGGWVIPKASKVTDAAFEYARWSATDFQPQMAKDHDWIPLNNAARESQDMLAGMPSGFKSSLATISDAQIGDLYHQNAQQILNEVLGPILGQVYENQLTPEDAAKQIDEKANELLAKA
jgi:multiple sugar transport system substrate-binding protein